jgi:hypothetical protein
MLPLPLPSPLRWLPALCDLIQARFRRRGAKLGALQDSQVTPRVRFSLSVRLKKEVL